jgi:hypothetical protein
VSEAKQFSAALAASEGVVRANWAESFSIGCNASRSAFASCRRPGHAAYAREVAERENPAATRRERPAPLTHPGAASVDRISRRRSAEKCARRHHIESLRKTNVFIECSLFRSVLSSPQENECGELGLEFCLQVRFDAVDKREDIMGAIHVGETIEIPCDVKPGPFSDEKFISFETLEGVVSGFVDGSAIQQRDSNFFIVGIVKEVEPDRIIVMVRGDFFQTNGIAAIPRSMACAA